MATYAIYQGNSTYFTHPNALGSTTMVTDYDGNVVQDKLFYPWGQDWQTIGTLYDERFAKLQRRDTETSLDPTANRTFASLEDRWLTPDPGGTRVTNPMNSQTWNHYAYVLGNPTAFADPLGLERCVPGAPGYEDDCPTYPSNPSTDPFFDASNGSGGWTWPSALQGTASARTIAARVCQGNTSEYYRSIALVGLGI